MNRANNICEKLAPRIGKLLPSSRWMMIDHKRITAFADVTEDHQFIHLDSDRAVAETSFDGTIAHGYLTLSMASAFAYEVMQEIEGQTASVNYGFEKIRFLAPVPAGSRIRGNFVLKSAVPKGDSAVLQMHGLSIEIEGADTPALVADWLTLHQL
jgi:acyl dehydratase